MHKGISPVIASIILVLVVLSLVGAYSVFTGRVAGTQIESGQQRSQELTAGLTTAFKIDGVEKQDVVVRNIGSQTIRRDSLTVVIDDVVLNYTIPADITKGATGRLTVKGLWLVGPGSHTLKVQSAIYGDSLPIVVEPNGGNVLDLRFEEGTGDTALDSSANNNHGRLRNDPAWITGKMGKALRFDGVDDDVEVTYSQSIDIKGSLTLCARVKPENEGVHVGIRWGIPNGAYWLDQFANNVINVNQSDINTTVYEAPQNLWVGSAYNGHYFQGSIDEVRVYNRAYGPDELYVLKPA